MSLLTQVQRDVLREAATNEARTLYGVAARLLKRDNPLALLVSTAAHLGFARSMESRLLKTLAAMPERDVAAEVEEIGAQVAAELERIIEAEVQARGTPP